MAARVRLNFPRSLWTAQDTLRLASNTLASIKLRTSQGLDANGRPFDDYSSPPDGSPIYVSKKGARLAPKGGRLTKSGKSVFYKGGYKEYKHSSRQRGSGTDSAEVDLVLPGNMMNNLVVKEATVSRFVIGLTTHAQYGYYVNEKREFIGLSPRDVEVMVKAAENDIRKKLKR